jgi:hypothetical protein
LSERIRRERRAPQSPAFVRETNESRQQGSKTFGTSLTSATNENIDQLICEENPIVE